MKSHLLLIVAAILMSFISGYYALFIQGDPVATPSEVREINNLKAKFSRAAKKMASVDFDEIYSTGALQMLLRPVSSFQNPNYDKSVYSSNKDCFTTIQGISNFAEFEKAFIWEEFRCGKRKYVTADFLSSSPYMHPSGLSYAYLIYLASPSSRLDEMGLANVLRFFHISELHYLKRKFIKLPTPFNYLADLTDFGVVELIQGAHHLLSKKYVFIKKSYIFEVNNHDYFIYDRSELDIFLNKTAYRAQVLKANQNCFYRDEGICWSLPLAAKLQHIPLTHLGLLAISILVTLLVVLLLINRLKLQRLEEEQRRLALQVLGHEFRTPITSLLLSLENLAKKMESADDETQEEYLRLSSAVHRLQRLTEMSRNYLRVGPRKSLIHLESKHINSLNIYFEQMLDDYLDQVELNLLAEDRSFDLDEYWIGICCKNLVENALAHGVKPIRVGINVQADFLQFTVEDQGSLITNDLKLLTEPFFKGKRSDGSGLGLNIVYTVIKSMGGEMELKTNPTRFILKIRNQA
jgi:signal transduction histidine kinase